MRAQVARQPDIVVVKKRYVISGCDPKPGVTGGRGAGRRCLREARSKRGRNRGCAVRRAVIHDDKLDLHVGALERAHARECLAQERLPVARGHDDRHDRHAFRRHAQCL